MATTEDAPPDGRAGKLQLQELRDAMGWTQREVGERAGLSSNHIVQIEGGYIKLDKHSTRIKAALGYGLDLPTFDAFFAGELPVAEAVAAAEKRLSAV